MPSGPTTSGAVTASSSVPFGTTAACADAAALPPLADVADADTAFRPDASKRTVTIATWVEPTAMSGRGTPTRFAETDAPEGADTTVAPAGRSRSARTPV